MDITSQVRTPPAASNSREPGEHGGLLALSGQERGGSDVGEVAVRGEDTVSASTARMDSTFGDLICLVRLDKCRVSGGPHTRS